MASKSRGVGVLSRNLRPRSKTLAIRSSKRWMAVASDSNSLSQNESFLPSIATPSQHPATTDGPPTTKEPESDSNEIRPPRSVQLAYLRPLKRTPKYRIPTCNLQLRSYSVRNLEFFTSFALRAAYFLNLPAVGPIPLPKQIERWTVPKGHFVHKKSQENFERITLRRLIQIQDGHPETVQMWLAYLRKRSYYAVGMKANVWSFEKLGLGKEMDLMAENGESLEQRWTSQFSPQMTPGIQTQADELTEEYEPEAGENIFLGKSEAKSPEKKQTSVQKRIEEVLAQIERQATSAAGKSPEVSDLEQAEDMASPEASILQETVAPNEEKSLTGDMRSPSSANVSSEAATDIKLESISTDPILSQESQIQQATEAVEQPPTDNVSSTGLASDKHVESLSSPDIAATESVEAASLSAADVAKKSTNKKATRSSTKRTSKKASESEGVKAPKPSDVDTSKDVSTPEEADPSIKPQTEEAKEAEKEDAQEPLGDLPKTPS